MEEYGLQNKAQEIAEKISGVETPVLGFVLGSGWGGVVEALRDCRRFAYKEIGLSECGVAGHAGNLVFGKLCDVPVVIQQGRFHLYEGREVFETVLPIAVMKELGVRSVVLTNAAGGLNPSFHVGDLMFLTDHINFSGKNPLTGLHPTDKYPVFVDMTKVYDAEMTNLLALAAERAGVRSRRGVYMQVPGPSFETPAEIRAFQKLGADAVGMSTGLRGDFCEIPPSARCGNVLYNKSWRGNGRKGDPPRGRPAAISAKREKILCAFAGICENIFVTRKPRIKKSSLQTIRA